MKKFIEEYGFAILATIVVILLILMASPIGITIKDSIEGLVIKYTGTTDEAFETVDNKLNEVLNGSNSENDSAVSLPATIEENQLLIVVDPNGANYNGYTGTIWVLLDNYYPTGGNPSINSTNNSYYANMLMQSPYTPDSNPNLIPQKQGAIFADWEFIWPDGFLGPRVNVKPLWYEDHQIIQDQYENKYAIVEINGNIATIAQVEHVSGTTWTYGTCPEVKEITLPLSSDWEPIDMAELITGEPTACGS